ncbi:TRAP transporter small permease [Granulosicoccus antarcticus]|uniref:TRAP transporter small permease protein n=1 Tax=Granulosicoccus antarcticus IMCC3135 TaxID=1192854 RepID=A0A2Z2NGB6_9GAMM|nr:TRAP transporter small permease [Granulosicoccus antarcticus]ASJ70302.1 hypothetical protein IMCC3135_00880 [Granulosicoccus antarcticus IMCC3135]
MPEMRSKSSPTRVQTLFDNVSRTGATVAWTLIALVTFVDVVGREVFSMPIPGGYEIIQILMTIGVFFSLPIVALRRGHVRVDLLYQSMPASLKRLSDVFSKLVSIVYFSLLAWGTTQFFLHAMGTGERSVYLHMPHWMPALLMGAFLIATVFCCVITPSSDGPSES